MLYCFLDTNVFLQFDPIEDIDWLKELQTTEVCLVFTSVIIRELDKFKTSNSNRLRKRARGRSSFLRSLGVNACNEIRSHTNVRFELAEPNRQILEDNNLLATVADDVLIAKAIEFAQQNSADEVAIVSDDDAVYFKASSLGIRALSLSEDCRLDPETDPLVKENQELKNELLKLKNDRPNLELGFESNNRKLVTFLHAGVSVCAKQISQDEIASRVEHKRSEILQVSDIEESVYGRTAVLLREMTRTDDFGYGDYVDSWLARKYAPFLRAKSIHDVFHKRTIPIDLTIQNSGIGTAEGLNITLQISGDWRLELESRDEPVYPEEPAPRSQWRFTEESAYSDSVFDVSKLDFQMTNPANPIITRTVEVDEPKLKIVRYSISRVRPDETLKLYPLYLFPTNSECLPKTFTVEYEILKDNPGPKQTGQLSVIVSVIDT